MSHSVERFGRCIIAGTIHEGIVQDDHFISGAQRVPLRDVKPLAPCLPTKIIGVGRNYAEHAQEMNNPLPKEPLLFFKPPSALNDPDGDIVYPTQTRELHYEGELAVVIGSRCRNVFKTDAARFIRGYTLCNDVTARDLQRNDGQWSRAKGSDTFAPLGPWIVSGLDPARLQLRTFLNGRLRQDASTSDLIFDVPTLVEFISASFTLEAGDVITTGTPKGVGPLQPGDVIEVRIEEIGTLRNRVVAA
ncbi:MAG TPA: fumarylacetoacetate hydrolase family protein [Candidatus Eremiobacteraceae bacterium]|nr:fumarylacetoacetate hydrolase family protein [Candidatus Eremiobacteraceae bacterium]